MRGINTRVRREIKRTIAFLLVICMLPLSSLPTKAETTVYSVSGNAVSDNFSDVIEQEYVMEQDWTLQQDECVYSMRINAGTLDLNGYTLTVLGDVLQTGGDVRINGGTLHIYGDYLIQGIGDSTTSGTIASNGILYMMNEDDLVTVSGNFISDSSVNHSGKLTAGVMKLYGDFYVYKTKSNQSFVGTNDHTIIMCGESSQVISFPVSDSYYSRIANLILEDKESEDESFVFEGVPCVTGRIMDRTVKTPIEGWIGVGGDPVFENGFYKGDICAVRTINIRQPLTVSGNFLTNANAGVYFQADFLVMGDMTTSGDIVMNHAHVTVEGDMTMKHYSYNRGLIMENEDAKLTVSGNFICEAAGSTSGLTDGTIEVWGDFTAKSGFWAQKNNRVILNGAKAQTINMAQGMKFATLELRNTSPEGIYAEHIFVSDSLITNGCCVTYLNDTGETGWTLGEDTVWDGNLVLLGGDLNLNGHRLTIQGDLVHKGGSVKVSGGSLQVSGDYRMETEEGGVSVGALRMQNAQDRVTVSGNFISRTNHNHEGLLTDGTMEVKGDFYVYKEDFSKTFYASDNHTVVLSGEQVQTVTVEDASLTGNGFQNLTIRNESENGVTFTGVTPVKGRVHTFGAFQAQGTIGIGADTEILYGVEESGYYKGDVNLLAHYTVDKPLEIDGNLNANTLILTLQEDLSVTGDFITRNKVTFEEATLTIGNDFAMSSVDYIDGISMQHATDRMYVGGDFSYSIPKEKKFMTDGVIEIKGDVTLSGGFRATENHKILLSGDSMQTINSGSVQTIATLELNNHSEEGVMSKNALNVKEIITNGCRFRYENIEGISGFCLEGDMTVRGDLTMLDGYMDLNGYTLTVTGNLIQIGGVIDVHNGTLYVGGNYYMQYRTDDGSKTGLGTGMLKMTNPEDLVCVDGDMLFQTAVSTKGNLTAGEIQIKGDLLSHSASPLQTEGTHCITMCGDKQQKIKIYSTKHGIQNLVMKNISDEGIVIDISFYISGQLTDESKKISGIGSVYVESTSMVKNGYFGGNLRTDKADILTQDMEIGGDFYAGYNLDLNGHSIHAKNMRTEYNCNINHGKLYVSENFVIGAYSRLQMTNPDDEVLVVGDMTMFSKYNHKGVLTDGTLEVRGDFLQKSYVNFVATGNHTTILGRKQTEDGKAYIQKISFDNPGEARFHTLVLKKMRQTGYEFSTDVYTLADEVIEEVTDETPPTPVTGLCVKTVTPGSISVSYNGAQDENGVAGYHIYRDGEKVGVTGETIYTDSGLVPGQTYTYTVYALDYCQNQSAASDELIVTTASDAEKPTQVTGLTVDRVTGSKVCLKWDASTDDGKITGYNVYRDEELIAENVTQTYYHDNTIEPLTLYTYVVTALDTCNNESENSESVTAVGYMPRVVNVLPTDYSSIGGDEVTLSVRFKDFGNSMGNTVTIDWQEQGSELWTPVCEYALPQKKIDKETLGASVTWDISAFTQQKNIDVRYTIMDEDGNIAEHFVTYDLDKTGALPPEEVQTEDQGGNLLVTWTASRSSDCAGYIIYRLENRTQWEKLAVIKGTASLSWLDQTTESDAEYSYCVSAYDAFGQEGEKSEAADGVSGEDTIAPVIQSIAPVDALVSGVTKYIVRAEDNCSVQRLKLYIRREDEITKKLLVSSLQGKKAAQTEYQLDTTKYADGCYVIYAEAVDDAGNVSEEYRRYYNIDNTGIAKMSFAKCTSTSTAIRLNWEDVQEEDFAYFSVEQKIFGEFEEIAQVSDVLSYTVKNLVPDTEYTFRVVAYDKAGNRGCESDEITLTTTSDAIRPQIAAIGPGEGDFSGKIPLMLRADDNFGIGKAVISWSTNKKDYETLAQITSEVNPKSETFRYDWDISSLPDGTVYVKFEAYDTVGNLNAPSEDGDIVAAYKVDNTPPAQVSGLTASGGQGAVSLVWRNNAEENIKYRIYRAQEDGLFRLLTESAYGTEYIDTNVEPNESYMYYVTAVDAAGNEGESSANAEAMCQPDRQAPVITGVTTVSDNCLGKKTGIQVLAIDNSRMSHIRLEYRKQESEDNYIRMESANPEGRSCYAEFSMEDEVLEEGTVYEFRFSAVDAAGNVSQYKQACYTFDLTPPAKPELTATSESFYVGLSWTENSESDFAYYKLYRRRYNSSKEECLITTGQTTYEDRSAEPDSIYYYRVEAYDEVGNCVQSAEKYSYANTIDTVAPTAILPEFQMQQFGREMSFDGSSSYDNVRIVSYVWDFGDECFGSGAKVSHYYEKPGDYDVTLTVYDAMGNSAVAEMIAQVGTEAYQTIISVTDQEGKPLADADVYIKNVSEQIGEEINLATDSNGEAVFVGDSAYYQIAAFKPGYIPMEEVVLLEEEQENEVHLVLSEGNVVAGDISCRRMELPEMIENGVDLSDPANYHTYRCELTLIFESRALPVEFSIIIPVKAAHNSAGNGKTTGQVGAGEPIDYEGEGDDIRVYAAEDGAIVTTILSVESSVSWLKEMYNVSLNVINCSSGSFTIENGIAMLEVPNGMSFMESDISRSTQQNIDTIYAGQTRSVGWVVRGDTSGKYKIGAQFSGSLMPFDRMIYAQFETEKDVEVLAGEGLHLQFRPEDADFVGHDYYIYASLTNTSGRTFYNMTFTLGNATVKSPEQEVENGSGEEVVVKKEIGGSTVQTAAAFMASELGLPEEMQMAIMATKSSGSWYGTGFAEAAEIATGPKPIKADSTGVEPDPWDRNIVKTRYGYYKIPGGGSSSGGTEKEEDSDNNGDAQIKFAGQLSFEDNKIAVSALYPGESLNLLMRTNAGLPGDPKTEYLKLVAAYASVLEGENLGVEVSINVVDSHVPMPTLKGEAARIVYTEAYGDPVSTVNGAFTQELETLTVKGADELSLRLFYNSLTAEDVGEAGRGFSHSYEQYILNYGSWIALRDGRANEIKYTLKETSGEEEISKKLIYEPAADKMEGTTIEKDENGYLLLLEDGSKMTFDKFGFLTGFSGPEGRHISVTWDDNDMILTEDISGEKLRLSYNEDGHLSKVADNHGRAVTLAYDEDNCLISMTDVLGNTTKFEYDSSYHMKKVINAAGDAIVQNTYDEYGRVITQQEIERGMPSVFTYEGTEEGMKVSVTDHLGNQTVTESDARGNVIRQVDGNGNTTKSVYEEGDLLKEQTDAGGRKTIYTYTEKEELATVIDPQGNVMSYAYDEDGNLTEITFADGTKNTYTYGEKKQLLSVTDALGATTTKTYDINGLLTEQKQAGVGTVKYSYEKGRLATVADANGGVTTLKYDTYGNLTEQTDAEGNVTKWNYDVAGNLLSEISPSGTRIDYTYDSLYQVTEQTESTAGGEVRKKTFTYDKAGRMTSETDALGRKTSYTYDAEDRLIEITHPDGTSEKNTYDAAGNLIRHIAGNGLVTEYTPDVFGNVVRLQIGEKTYTYDVYPSGKIKKETRPDGSVIRYSYDENYNCITMTDALGNVTTYAYDAMSHLIKETDPLGGVTSYTYDAAGRMTSVTDANGNTTSYGYDGNGNNTTLTDALGNVTEIGHDKNNRPKYIRKTVSGETIENKYTYDAEGNLLSITDAAGRVYTTAYNGYGEIVSEVNELGDVVSQKTYDDGGRLTANTDAFGIKTAYSYDVADRITELVQAQGTADETKISYSYDTAGNLTLTTDAGAGSAKATYDLYGNMISKRDAMGNKTTYEYDLMDRCIKETNALGKSEIYVYDKNGRLKEVTDREGNITIYQYDKAGRLIKEKTGLFETTYTYDAAGNLLTATDASGVIKRTYDRLNRVTSVTDHNGKTIKYSYDELGNRISLTYPGGEIVRYTWDKCQQLIGMTDTAGGITTYGYDAAGRLTETKRADGSVEIRDYDAAGRLTEITDTAADGEILQKLTYTYDSRGNITKIEGADKTAAGQDNMTCTYGKDNRLLTWNGQTVTYDDNGNMLSGPANGKWAEFSYDIYDRLIKVTTKDGAKTTYSYDAEGVRTKTTYTDATGETWEETYVTDRETTYSQLLSSTCAGKTTTYTYGLGLASATEGGKETYYHYDHLGSATLLTNKAGEVTTKASYGTYGELLGVTGANGEKLAESATGQTVGKGTLGFLYNAQYGIRTDANGLYYMRARYYSPDAKRFLTLDPVKGELTNTQSLNRYAYVQGNPVSAIDPLGLSPLLSLARLVPDVETMLDIARILPGTGTIMGAYDLYQAIKQKDRKKVISTVAFLGMGTFGGIGKGIKFLHKAEKLSDRSAGILLFATNALATACQGELLCESIEYAREEMKAGSGKLSDISATSWTNIAVTGIGAAIFGIGTIKSIPRIAPTKLKARAIGKGKTQTTAVKEVVSEMPAVSGKVRETNYAQSSEKLDWDAVVSRRGETRQAHVALHESNDLSKPSHGVFYGDSISTINKAWDNRANGYMIPEGSTNLYIIPYQNAGYAGGYGGQGNNLNYVTIVTQHGTNNIITGFPGNGFKYTLEDIIGGK